MQETTATIPSLLSQWRAAELIMPRTGGRRLLLRNFRSGPFTNVGAGERRNAPFELGAKAVRRGG